MTNIKGNIFGGITAGVVALPLALAFGVASGMGPTAGLYGAIVLGFFAALLGGTKTQISGPTGPMTVVMASAFTTLSGDMNSIALVILLAGVIQIILGIFKIGKWIKYIPYPVISGFMSGIGIIIIILQINPYIGVDGSGSIMQTLSQIPSNILNTNIDALILASLTLAIMLFTPKKITKIVPSALIGLISVTLISVLFDFQVPVIGEIPQSLPEIHIPSFLNIDYKTVLTLAMTLALLATIDSLLTSLVADSLTKTKHKPNKELIGQGIGNALCSFVGGIPGAGATMRTVVNIKSGGTHRISGMIHSIMLLLTVLFFAPLAAKIPLAVLAGILIKVGLDILDYKFLQVIKGAPRHDLLIMIVVFLLTVFVDLITAVFAGIVIASLLIVYRVTKETKINIISNKEENHEFDQLNEKVRIINIDGPFFFGSSTIFENNINKIMGTKVIIINCLDVPFFDLTAIFALKDMILKMKDDKDAKVLLILKDKHKKELLKINKNKTFDLVEIFNHTHKAIEKANKYVEEKEANIDTQRQS